MDLTFPNASWGTATVTVYYACSSSVGGRLISTVMGHNALGSTSVTNYVDGSGSVGDRFDWEYQGSSPNKQRLRIRAGSSSDLITCLISVVMTSRSGDTDPTVTFYG